MTTAITTAEFLSNVILAGGGMGLIGQGVRSAVGLKKLRDKSGNQASVFSDNFSASKFFSSLVFGFIAGALTAFFMLDDTTQTPLTKSILIGFMGAGYAGADIIDGFAAKIMPGSRQAT